MSAKLIKLPLIVLTSYLRGLNAIIYIGQLAVLP